MSTATAYSSSEDSMDTIPTRPMPIPGRRQRRTRVKTRAQYQITTSRTSPTFSWTNYHYTSLPTADPEQATSYVCPPAISKPAPPVLSLVSARVDKAPGQNGTCSQHPFTPVIYGKGRWILCQNADWAAAATATSDPTSSEGKAKAAGEKQDLSPAQRSLRAVLDANNARISARAAADSYDEKAVWATPEIEALNIVRLAEIAEEASFNEHARRNAIRSVPSAPRRHR